MFQDKLYFKTLLKIALPLIVQYAISAVMNFVDVIMIGQLGEASIAAVGLSNQIFFILLIILFGVGSGAAIFTAQFWGKRDIDSIRKVQGIGLILALIIGGIFTAAIIGFPHIAIGIFSRDPQVIHLGSDYLFIAGWSYIFYAITVTYSATLRSTENVKLPMLVTSAALSLKTLLNYALIFGNFGFPALNLAGAAYATVIARVVECIALLCIVYAGKTPAAASLKQMRSFSNKFFKEVLKTVSPVIFNEIMWSIGVSLYSLAYARISTESIAAYEVNVSIDNLVFVIFLGITDATGVIVGNRIGASEEKKATIYARYSLLLCVIIAIATSIVVLLTRNTVLSFYNFSETTHNYTYSLLTILALTIWVRVSNLVMIIGVFRSGGDTRFCLLMDAGGVWVVGVPMAFIGAFFLHLPVYWVYLMVMAEEFVKFGLGLWRLFSGKWLNNLTRIAEPALYVESISR
jgi:putative MATE family efflux protein